MIMMMIATRFSTCSMVVVGLFSVTPALAGPTGGDAVAGAQQFKQKCLMCHTVTPGAKAGAAPNLAGVANRPAAATSFAYSAALKGSKLKWDAQTLNIFLTAPAKAVPGTRMLMPVPDVTARANIVAYLMTLKK